VSLCIPLRLQYFRHFIFRFLTVTDGVDAPYSRPNAAASTAVLGAQSKSPNHQIPTGHLFEPREPAAACSGNVFRDFRPAEPLTCGRMIAAVTHVDPCGVIYIQKVESGEYFYRRNYVIRSYLYFILFYFNNLHITGKSSVSQ
jgi:hypothetical protein